MAVKKTQSKKPVKKKSVAKSRTKKSVPKSTPVKPAQHRWLVPIGIIVLVFAVLMVKVEYTDREAYVEIETYQITTQQVVADYNNPIDMRICSKTPAQVRVEVDPFTPYVDPVGYGYECEASFRVWNLADSTGKWTYSYTFVIGDKTEKTPSVTKEIPRSSAIRYTFTSTLCEKDDDVSGYYTLESSPLVESCTYETTYPNITVSQTEDKQREVPKERLVTKYERLWQKLLGVNKA